MATTALATILADAAADLADNSSRDITPQDVRELIVAICDSFLHLDNANATNLIGSEIKTLYEAESDTNAYADADVTKLGAIEASADVTDAINVASSGAPIITSGSVVPSSTPGAAGDIYVNTTALVIYIAVGSASSADWQRVNPLGVIDMQFFVR